jgi:hypothetical protein
MLLQKSFVRGLFTLLAFTGDAIVGGARRNREPEKQNEERRYTHGCTLPHLPGERMLFIIALALVAALLSHAENRIY